LEIVKYQGVASCSGCCDNSGKGQASQKKLPNMFVPPCPWQAIFDACTQAAHVT
jgi:hypothetical protein